MLPSSFIHASGMLTKPHFDYSQETVVLLAGSIFDWYILNKISMRSFCGINIRVSKLMYEWLLAGPRAGTRSASESPDTRARAPASRGVRSSRPPLNDANSTSSS